MGKCWCSLYSAVRLGFRYFANVIIYKPSVNLTACIHFLINHFVFKGCRRPQLNANINVAVDQMFFDPGVELALSCKEGYTPISGPRTIVCTTSGAWSATKFLCKRGSPFFL